MFLYNPLGSHSKCFSLYASAEARAREARAVATAPELIELYSRAGAHRVFEEDERELTLRVRAFWPLLLEHSGLPAELHRVRWVFPRSHVLDSRALTHEADPVVFVTGGVLDAIAALARTVSCSAQLNRLALPALTGVEQASGDLVLLAWLMLQSDSVPAMPLIELFEHEPTSLDGLRELIFAHADWAAAPLRPGLARYHLSNLLCQSMLRAIRQAARSGWAPQHAEGAGAWYSETPIEREYLEVLLTCFVGLHELGHLLLGHDRPGQRSVESEAALTQQLVDAAPGLEGAERLLSLVGTGVAFELAADVFALSALGAASSEAMLEAASLWCVATEPTHGTKGAPARPGRRLRGQRQATPHALRVWYINGRLCTGLRAGRIARELSAAAEVAGPELDEPAPDAARERALRGQLWELASAATAYGSVWSERAGAPASEREPSALEPGLRAWQAGQLQQAEALFRSALLGAHPALAAQARGLLGRVLEESGDVQGAEAEYRAGDTLGDGDAANDLGVLLQERGELDAALAAFERAAARGNGPGAYNLGLHAAQRGDRAAALSAFRSADRLGHAYAALNLGMLVFHGGDLDAAEAALWRAEARDATGAATYLGVVQRARADLVSAEAAWRRGAARGELDALHNLGCLLEQGARLDEACAVLGEAVARGRTGSAAKLRALEERRRGLQSASAAADADPELMLRAGRAAARDGQTAQAIAQLEHAERLGHPGAVRALGEVLLAAGDASGAEAAYRRAAERGHAGASFELGGLLSARGDVEGARAAWAHADALGDGAAATQLGLLLETVGAVAAAHAAYERASARGHTAGMLRHARVLERSGNSEGAVALYERADAAGDADAATALGALRQARGDAEGAEQAWRRGDLRGSPEAALRLGMLLREQGKLDAAEAALRRALDRGQAEAAPQLSSLFEMLGYERDARALWPRTAP